MLCPNSSMTSVLFLSPSMASYTHGDDAMYVVLYTRVVRNEHSVMCVDEFSVVARAQPNRVTDDSIHRLRTA